MIWTNTKVVTLSNIMSTRQGPREEKNLRGARPFAGPPAPPFPTLVI